MYKYNKINIVIIFMHYNSLLTMVQSPVVQHSIIFKVELACTPAYSYM